MATDLKPSGRIVIAGGSGFLGLKLARHLAGFGCEVIILSRSAPATDPSWRHVKWDARSVGDWVDALDGSAALVNLTGRSVDCIKSPEHCDEILRSRVESTQVLGKAVRKIKNPPPVWVQMSTAHIYGDPPDVVCDEESAPGYGLAPFVATAWEEAFARAVLPEMRQVILRTSFVLGCGAGAMRRLAPMARLGFGGTVGNGRQGISWIHEHDMDRLFERAIADPNMKRIYMATAPNPVSNAEFMRALRNAVRMPIGLPAPAFLIKLAAPLVLRTDPELALCGRYCVSKRLPELGFEFKFAEVGAAFEDLYRLRGRVPQL